MSAPKVFKVSDRVRVVMKSEPHNWAYYWDDEMDAAVGLEGIVRGVDSSSGEGSVFIDFGANPQQQTLSRFGWPNTSLELAWNVNDSVNLKALRMAYRDAKAALCAIEDDWRYGDAADDASNPAPIHDFFRELENKFPQIKE